MSVNDVLNLARATPADGWAPPNFVTLRKEFPEEGLFVIASIEPDPAAPEHVLRCGATAFGLKSQKRLGVAQGFASPAELESSWHITEFVNRTAKHAVTAALAGAIESKPLLVSPMHPHAEGPFDKLPNEQI